VDAGRVQSTLHCFAREYLYLPLLSYDKCNKTGCRGRIDLHELLIVDDDIKKLIQEWARVAEIFAAVVEGGMRPLKMDGM
jgi:type II secretory ATPase GspE/PulE/Tfp pilus assembly ATPase PilB-like protein